jgi:hypothetical protein
VKGETGAAGAEGKLGKEGKEGAKGAQGVKGEAGLTGAEGKEGKEGKLGVETVITADIAKEAVTSAKLGTEAVEAGKLKKEAVTAAKLAVPTAKPAKPAEGAIVVGAASPVRKVSAAIVGTGAKKEWVIEHNLETRLVEVTVQAGEGEEPAELEAGAGYKVKAISAKSVEVVFTTAPAAKALLYITVVG